MTAVLIGFCLAFACALVLTPVVRWLSPRLGFVDPPGGRKLQSAPVPRSGGLAILLAFLTPLAVLLLAGIPLVRIVFDRTELAVGIMGGSVAIAFVGATDDLKGLRARWKLLFQIGVASFCYVMGFKISLVDLPWVGLLATSILPPCARAMVCARLKPSPTPASG